jgi:hypothetical protein
LFCAGNAVAIFADYLYQLFVFVPVLVLLAKREQSRETAGVHRVSKAKMEKRRGMQKKVSFVGAFYGFCFKDDLYRVGFSSFACQQKVFSVIYSDFFTSTKIQSIFPENLIGFFTLTKFTTFFQKILPDFCMSAKFATFFLDWIFAYRQKFKV